MRRISIRLAAAAAALIFVFGHLTASCAPADDALPKPRVKVALSSAERVMGDLEWIIAQLAQEKGQWQDNIFPSLDIFLFGVDRQLPIRFDMLLGGGQNAGNPGPAYRLQMSVPIERNGREIRTFITQNLQPIGINVRQKSRRGYYELQNVYEGWMRMVDEYACIGTYESDVPEGMPHPKLSHEELLKPGYDIALELDNLVEQTDERIAAFDEFESNMLDATKPKEEESEAGFALRKETLAQQLERFERLFVDARRVTIGWTTDVEQEEGRANLYGEALPDTELAQFIDMISVEPSAFATLEVPEDPAFSFRVNLPFSDLRKGQLADFYSLSKPVAHEKIDADETITSEEKQPAKQIADLFFNMLTEGIELGRLDLFVDMTKTGEAEDAPHVIITGIRATDGKKADEIVQLIPQAKTKWSVEMDVETLGETAIHAVNISADLPQSLADTFGDSGLVYVGTSPGFVWICGGPGSLELLKETITRVDEAEAPEEISPVFGEFKAHSHTLLNLYHTLSVEMGWELFGGSIEVQPRREDAAIGGGELQPIDPVEMRKIALNATAGIDDRISGKVRRIDNHAEGEILVAPGMMRAVGKIVAKLAADNLQ